MDLRFIIALILSILPISELRGGLPLAILYARDNNLPIMLVFISVVLANIFAIFIAFFFLNVLHKGFMKINFYRRFFSNYIKRFQAKADKFEKKYKSLGFFALAIFVAIPLPGTGAWTGVLLSWLLNLNRKKSIIAIALGVLIAGIIILFGTLGFISVFS